MGTRWTPVPGWFRIVLWTPTPLAFTVILCGPSAATDGQQGDKAFVVNAGACLPAMIEREQPLATTIRSQLRASNARSYCLAGWGKRSDNVACQTQVPWLACRQAVARGYNGADTNHGGDAPCRRLSLFHIPSVCVPGSG